MLLCQKYSATPGISPGFPKLLWSSSSMQSVFGIMVMRFQPGNDTEQSQGHDIEDDGGYLQDTVSSCAMGMNALRFHGIQC